MSNTVFQNTIKRYVPEATVSYCSELWLLHKFRFIVKKKRASKLGDYSYNRLLNQHTITVNGDLNPYAFLITYLHEVAHLLTATRHGFRVKPHGEEWKTCFKEVLYPILREEVFPANVIAPLYDYIGDPKATSCSDVDLLKALSEHDEHKLAFLTDVKPAETFRFNKKYFRKDSVVRTRAICTELSSNKKYYIPLAAQVEIMQTSLF
jgi:SprT protein